MQIISTASLPFIETFASWACICSDTLMQRQSAKQSERGQVSTSEEMTQGSGRVRQILLARFVGLTSWSSYADCTTVNEQSFQVSPGCSLFFFHLQRSHFCQAAQTMKTSFLPASKVVRPCSCMPDNVCRTCKRPRSQVTLSLYSSLLNSPTFRRYRCGIAACSLQLPVSRPVQPRSSHL